MAGILVPNYLIEFEFKLFQNTKTHLHKCVSVVEIEENSLLEMFEEPNICLENESDIEQPPLWPACYLTSQPTYL